MSVAELIAVDSLFSQRRGIFLGGDPSALV